MIGRHRIGLLGASLLALGVVQIPPVPVDMTAAEQTIAELQQNGLDPLSIAAHAGAEGFVKLARAVLAMQHAQRALGVEMTTPQLIAEVNALARPADMGRIDLQPMYDLGARRVTIGDERGVPLAHVTLREDRSVHPRDIVSTRPVLGNRIPGPRMDVAAQIASAAMKTLARAPKPAKEPRDRKAQRPEQAKARAAKSRKRARKGWA